MAVAVKALVNPAEHISALRKVVQWADELHFAYAWATSSGGEAEHWRVIPLDRVKRAILGIHFAQTEPAVLRALRARGVLRVVPDTGGVFHPKLLVGMKGDNMRAIVGSSNLTAGGFSGNTEVSLLLSGSVTSPVLAKLASFIEDQWRHPRTFIPDQEWLDRYEQVYAGRPKPPKVGETRGTPRQIRTASDLAIDWPSYVDLIGRQERRALSNGWEIRVFDHHEGSYLQEVEACRAAFRSAAAFEDLSLEERKLVAGWGGGSSGYFGRMVGAGRFKHLTAERPDELGVYLDQIPLHGEVTTNMARDYLKGVTSIEGVAIGAATRLLCMKRPDLFLPANNASQDKILTVFGRRADTVDKYIRIISEVREYPWFATSEPDDMTEHRIWQARVALLDAIFYESV